MEMADEKKLRLRENGKWLCRAKSEMQINCFNIGLVGESALFHAMAGRIGLENRLLSEDIYFSGSKQGEGLVLMLELT